MISWWFHQGPNLNQWRRLIFNPVFIVGLCSPWSVLSFPSNDASVCVCVCGTLGAFSLDTSLGVWNTRENILPLEFHPVTRGKNTMKCKRVWTDPGRCWWRRGVNLLACCLARALVFSAYGCHVLPPPHPPEQKECIVTCMCTKLYTKLQEYYFAVLKYFFFFLIYVKDKGEVILL